MIVKLDTKVEKDMQVKLSCQAFETWEWFQFTSWSGRGVDCHSTPPPLHEQLARLFGPANLTPR